MRIPLLLLPLLLGSCFGRSTQTAFPFGLEPLEDNAVPIAPEEEGITVISGTTEDYAWVHGKGRVDAPLAEVWAAVQEPDVVVDRRRVDAWSTTWDVEEGYDVSLRIHHRVEDLVVVEYDLTWRHGFIEGRSAEEDTVAIRWQKTDGTALITLLEGSIVLRPDGEESTILDVVEHLDAPRQEPEMLVQFARDLHASIVAQVHGQPLPEY